MVFGTAIPSFGQLANPDSATGKPTNISLKVNALPLIFQSLNTFAEVRLNRNFSVCAAFNYWYSKKGALIFNRFDQEHTGFTLEYRTYLNHTALRGFYTAGYFKYRQILQKQVVNFLTDSLGSSNLETAPQDQKWTQAGAGGAFGYQHIFSSRFLVESFAGLGYYFHSQLKTDHPEWLTNFSKASRIDLRVGVSVGYSF